MLFSYATLNFKAAQLLISGSKYELNYIPFGWEKSTYFAFLLHLDRLYLFLDLQPSRAVMSEQPVLKFKPWWEFTSSTPITFVIIF